ncbi:hypothetical protein CHARACLAT_022081 [Characodon lateralis]|uniref:Uncharacterized protein n=1 Tax=Characodon lateralis TaxID=208331 RepID=A0ABU7D9R1_9TELE|nr:hypothetical protein [Characodon lateralis]
MHYQHTHLNSYLACMAGLVVWLGWRRSVPCVSLCASLPWGLLFLFLADDLLLCWAYGCLLVMLYVWLSGTATTFWTLVYLPFAALRGCGLQALYCYSHTYKCALPGDKLALTHTHSTQTHLFRHVCPPIISDAETYTHLCPYTPQNQCGLPTLMLD